MVCITATLAAIGSASVPNSALVSMITVLQVTTTAAQPALHTSHFLLYTLSDFLQLLIIELFIFCL